MMAKRSDKKRRLQTMINGSVTLNKEQWERVSQELLDAGPIIQEAIDEALKKMPLAAKEEGIRLHPGIEPINFETDIRLACTAITYVANFAADKCRFIMTKEDNGNGVLH